MTDEALILAVARAQQGDTRAFDALVRQFQNTAIAYARTLLHDQAAAEDAAQEAFVQAWRDLPRLTDAAAFGGWLRRIVFKFCDRIRRAARPMLPLAETLSLSEDRGPAWLVERADEAAQVRAAVDALPGPLREATLLYYLTGHDVKEIAAFLEVPPSTVKNRLHAARKRLRKELWTMAETILEREKPAQNEAFAGNVLARVLREFQQQEATDAHAANRGLLDEGQTALFQVLSSNEPLDMQTARHGLTLLRRKRDWAGIAALMMRVLNQPLSDSWTAWAYLNLANYLAVSGSPAGAVLAHEAFERWLPGKSPRVSARPSYLPGDVIPEGDHCAGQEVRLIFLGMSVEFTTSYMDIWRGNDYLAKVDAALAEIPVTPENRRRHFAILRMAAKACELAGDFDHSSAYIQQVYTLAAGAESETLQAELKAKALGHEINLARCRQNEEALMAAVTALATLLNMPNHRDVNWAVGERHNFACQLMRADRYELALPLWEANEASGKHTGGPGWFAYAATAWKLTHDRPRVLALLREARAHSDEDLVPQFTRCPEFADVWEDPEFLQAVGRK